MRKIILAFITIMLLSSAGLVSLKFSEKPEIMPTVVTPVSQKITAEAKTESQVKTKFYYVVRLENNRLYVFSCTENKEEYVYCKKIITENLTEEEERGLKSGKVFYTEAEVTEFMENYTS